MNHAIVPFEVTHKRFHPKIYEFKHCFFWLKLDLFNLNSWPTKFFGVNKNSLYSFFEKDHIDLGKKTARENFIQFAKESGLEEEIKEMYLYTSVRFLGYVFNPVCFVLMRDVRGRKHAIIEIGNTFGEQKPYFVHHDHFDEKGFVFRTKKLFYISPFIDHRNEMIFSLRIVKDRVSIFIDDNDGERSILKVWFKGIEQKATTRELVRQTFLVPFVTLKIISLIHFHALVLWLKKIKYFKKEELSEFQQGYFYGKHRKSNN
ncbi:MAG: hypothetical protein CME61_05500 [Halobacteriovoraceae bacterium]|nr:hypothetical protein [Halobacteriovoraceae bacterium]